MLIIGQSDKMHRDLSNIKGSTDLFALSMWILVSGDNQYVSNPVFSLCMSESLVKVQDTVRSLLHCSACSHFIAPPAHTSLLRLLTLYCSPCSHYSAPPAHTSLLPLITIHCSPCSHFIAPPAHWRLVTPLPNAAFRQSVHSQILFSITPGFVASN